MRWTRRRARRSAPARGRRSRVVLTPRRWRSSPRRRVRRLAGDGGKKARSPGRARRKPLKPLRGEGRVEPTSPVVTTLVCFFTLHTGPRVRRAPGLPCALHVREARSSWITRARLAPRECGIARRHIAGGNPHSVIPGRAQREPGIHLTACAWSPMDSGFDASHRPGMTAAQVLHDRTAPGGFEPLPSGSRRDWNSTAAAIACIHGEKSDGGSSRPCV
jgi:hypothetical protein